jgi:xanthine/uracil/vitamin C permease (AzgA family)
MTSLNPIVVGDDVSSTVLTKASTVLTKASTVLTEASTVLHTLTEAKSFLALNCISTPKSMQRMLLYTGFVRSSTNPSNLVLLGNTSFTSRRAMTAVHGMNVAGVFMSRKSPGVHSICLNTSRGCLYNDQFNSHELLYELPKGVSRGRCGDAFKAAYADEAVISAYAGSIRSGYKHIGNYLVVDVRVDAVHLRKITVLDMLDIARE